MGAELFHADGPTHRQEGEQTDTTKMTVGYRNFANAPKTMQIERQYCNGSLTNMLTHCKLVQNNYGNNNNNNNNNNNKCD
jgi:hypothetical protein